MRKLFVGAIAAVAMLASAQAAQAAPAACSAGYAAMTFDDGPTTLSQQYVTALKAAGVKATFFNVGANERALPTLAKVETTAGNVIGNHTETHPHLLQWSNDGVFWEMSDMNYYTKQQTGTTPYLFRPPYGESSGYIWDTAFGLGLQQVNWTLDTKDWEGLTTAQIVATANQAHNQSIVLMHDGYANTLKAIPQIVAAWKAKGLCAGRMVQSWDNPIANEWGELEYVNVRAF